VVIAGRSYARAYQQSGKRNVVEFLADAIQASGGRALHVSEATRAPVYLGAETADGSRIGILCYPFRCNPAPIKGRPPDEHRVQVRYGAERTWSVDHSVAHDVAGVDVTIVLGVHLQQEILVGLDPALYDPLPMGISVEFKDAQVAAALKDSWHVWERDNRTGTKRAIPRARNGLETLVAFTPDRLLDYVRLEREATNLALDPPLRYRAALAAQPRQSLTAGARHALEAEFDLDHATLLNIIEQRGRLKVAVKGGVAEHHLEAVLRNDPAVASVQQIDQDGPPDFEIVFRDGTNARVECKNASPTVYARPGGPDDAVGDPKVEVQKTRAQKNDPSGRLYAPNQFDVLAACLFATTGRWEFQFRKAGSLASDATYPHKIAAMQRINRLWAGDVASAR
jgi:hypothetical protein